MRKIIYLLFLLPFSCAYITTVSPARTYYIQLNKKIDIDKEKYYFEIVNGKIEIVDTLTHIYKASLYESNGGKTNFMGYDVKEVSNGDKTDWLYLYEWENIFDRIELLSLSYEEIGKKEYYMLDTISVYKISLD